MVFGGTLSLRFLSVSGYPPVQYPFKAVCWNRNRAWLKFIQIKMAGETGKFSVTVVTLNLPV